MDLKYAKLRPIEPKSSDRRNAGAGFGGAKRRDEDAA